MTYAAVGWFTGQSATFTLPSVKVKSEIRLVASSGNYANPAVLTISIAPDMVCDAVTSVGDGSSVDVAWSGGAGGGSAVTVSGDGVSGSASSSPVTVTGLVPGKTYTFTISDGQAKDGTCPPYAVPAVAAPAIDQVKVSGTDLQVTYSISGNGVAPVGIEYSLDGGATWAQPGGTPPIGSTGGFFTVPVAASGTVSVRSVWSGSSLGVYSSAVSSAFTVPPPPKSTSPSGSGSSGSGGSGSSLSGSSGSTTAAAVAAGARAAGSAPCLAPNDTLLPDMFGTVGSQLTMAPNTIGLPAASGFALTKGTMPPGMMLDATFGIVYGTPSAAGTWPITVKGSWPDGTTRSSAITITVAPDNASVQYASRNVANVGTPSVLHPAVTAGGTYALVCGTLPSGMTLNERTGEITGTPTQVVDYPTPLRVRQIDDKGRTTAAGSFILVVNPQQAVVASSIAYPAHPDAKVHRTIRIRPSVTGGPVSGYAVVRGKLPKGLKMNKRTGLIYGKPSKATTTHTVTVAATGPDGKAISAIPFSVKVRR